LVADSGNNRAFEDRNEAQLLEEVRVYLEKKQRRPEVAHLIIEV
jgi:hypothetical protein